MFETMIKVGSVLMSQMMSLQYITGVLSKMFRLVITRSNSRICDYKKKACVIIEVFIKQEKNSQEDMS